MPYRTAAAAAFSTQRQHLWDLCYRATGSAADADVLLRECFARAVERPLVVRDADWHSHLVRSAAFLAIDALRRRKRRRYTGCWLPSPIDTGNTVSRAPRPPTSAGGARYDAVESGSIAFLMALEPLGSRQRVSLLMSDAFGLTVPEVAAALDLTIATARGTLQQARRQMVVYDSTHDPPIAALQAATADSLRDCLCNLQNRDPVHLEKMLSPDARLCFDSGGEFVAPLAAVNGRAQIARVLLKFAEGVEPVRFAFRMLNGLPAALGFSSGRAPWPKQFVLSVEARNGLVTDVRSIMATAKLTAVRFDAA